MLWDIVILIAMWFVGMLLFSFGISQILICLFCAIPATKKFSKKLLVDSGYIYKRCAITILLWTIISLGVIFAVIRFANFYGQTGFLAGVVMTLVMSLGKFGMNSDNMADYFQVYGKAFTPKDLRRLIGDAEPVKSPENEEAWKVDAYNYVSKCAKKSGMSILEYCRKCAEQEYLSEGISAEQAKGRAEGRFTEPDSVGGFVEMAYIVVLHFAKKSGMGPQEYMKMCENQEGPQ